MEQNKIHYVWGLLRLGMGWMLFWTFIDKLLGLGFATTPENAWIAGGSPTFGFLKFATKGPFAEFYQGLIGNPVVEWLYMLGLLLIGLSLLLGVGVRIASYCGVLMFMLIYSAGFLPPEYNPFVDYHIIFSIILVGFTLTNSGHCLGLGKYWSNIKLVKKYPYLE